MFRDLKVLHMKEEDILKFLAAETHLGGTDPQIFSSLHGLGFGK